MTNPWKPALARYRRWFGWTGLQAGQLRDGKHIGWYCLPRVVDNWAHLGHDLWLRCTLRCITCMQRGQHRFTCYHSHRIRDDLIQLRLWPRPRGI